MLKLNQIKLARLRFKSFVIIKYKNEKLVKNKKLYAEKLLSLI